MTPNLAWMRHGSCNDGVCRPDAHARPESHLSPRGTRQAACTAQELLDSRITDGVVTSSTLVRARSTARIVAEITGLTLHSPNSVFDEWRAPTCVLGREPAQYPDAYINWRLVRSKRPEIALPGGESLVEFSHRAENALTEALLLAERAPYVLVVSHRLLIGAVAALRAGSTDPAKTFEHARNYALAPAEISFRNLPRPRSRPGSPSRTP